THSVEKDLGVEFAQAEELKLNVNTNRVPAVKRAVIERSLGKTLDVWMSGVELALGEFNQLDHLPHNILLCGGGSSLDSLTRELQQSDWYRKLPFSRKPVIRHIHPDQVVGIVDKTGKVSDHTLITAMGLLRVGMDTILQQDSTRANGSIKERIDRILRV
ncbi:MAG: cell division protein septum formation, partial [Candidatus Saccharibacteria bacterium]|nr:cell division protein septum formation [Candidatus Saccharibacteria bacterium]